MSSDNGQLNTPGGDGDGQPTPPAPTFEELMIARVSQLELTTQELERRVAQLERDVQAIRANSAYVS